MVNHFVKKILLGLSRIHVEHSIPGKLRLRVDGLEMVKYFFGDNEDIPLNFNFYRLHGIKNIEFSPNSSNILIEYDPAILRDNQIINWINHLREMVIRKFTSDGSNISQEVIDEIGSELRKEGYEMEKYRKDTSA